jgi:hypothetical protein
MTPETLHCHPAAELPDTEKLVLVYAPTDDEPVFMGWYDGYGWVTLELNEYQPGVVRAWAELPEGPR